MNTFWDFFWLMVWAFFFICYLMILFQIVGDLFRDHETNGWLKAIWIIFLVIFPFLTALVYLIARGSGMAKRQAAAMANAQAATDQYIQQVAGKGNPSEQIASAKALLDAGTIDQGEFDKLKAKALS